MVQFLYLDPWPSCFSVKTAIPNLLLSSRAVELIHVLGIFKPYSPFIECIKLLMDLPLDIWRTPSCVTKLPRKGVDQKEMTSAYVIVQNLTFSLHAWSVYTTQINIVTTKLFMLPALSRATCRNHFASFVWHLSVCLILWLY